MKITSEDHAPINLEPEVLAKQHKAEQFWFRFTQIAPKIPGVQGLLDKLFTSWPRLSRIANSGQSSLAGYFMDMFTSAGTGRAANLFNCNQEGALLNSTAFILGSGLEDKNSYKTPPENAEVEKKNIAELAKQLQSKILEQNAIVSITSNSNLTSPSQNITSMRTGKRFCSTLKGSHPSEIFSIGIFHSGSNFMYNAGKSLERIIDLKSKSPDNNHNISPASRSTETFLSEMLLDNKGSWHKEADKIISHLFLYGHSGAALTLRDAVELLKNREDVSGNKLSKEQLKKLHLLGVGLPAIGEPTGAMELYLVSKEDPNSRLVGYPYQDHRTAMVELANIEQNLNPHAQETYYAQWLVGKNDWLEKNPNISNFAASFATGITTYHQADTSKEDAGKAPEIAAAVARPPSNKQPVIGTNLI